MALVKCPECGKEISSTCDYCVHCGYRLRSAPKKIQAIAYRTSTPGWLTFFCVLCFIFGFLFFGLGILMMAYWASDSSFLFFPIAGALLFVLALVLFLAPIIDFVRMGQNRDLQGQPCVAYDEASGKLILAALNGKKIAISPSQYLDISCGFFTDFFLILFYLDERQRKKKARLGFTSNRWEAQRALVSLKDKGEGR